MVMDLIYSEVPSCVTDDIICWILSSHKVFAVNSFYKVLLPSATKHFPWKSVWKLKVATKASFLLWTAALEKTITTDNLRKRQLVVLDWYCMCKEDGGLGIFYVRCLVQ